MLSKEEVVKGLTLERDYVKKIITDQKTCDIFNNTKHLLLVYDSAIEMLNKSDTPNIVVPPTRENIEIVKLIKETGCNLTIGVNSNDNVYCFLEDCYISKGVSMNGDGGTGETILEAIADYMGRLKGNTLIVHPGSEKYRREIFIM